MNLTGQIVRFKPEWQDRGDETVVFRVVEDNGDRLLVRAELGLEINPTHVVQRDMVEEQELQFPRPL